MSTWKKHILRVICLGLVLSFVMGLSGCDLLQSGYQRIPELERLEGLDAARFDVKCAGFDGKELNHYSHSSFSFNEEDGKIFKEQVLKFISLKGKKVNNWSKDKITYPLYAITILPVVFNSRTYVPGESFVWSNGYLVTTSGDVYKCSPDFKPFLQEYGNNRKTHGRVDGISTIKIFRPLTHAGKKWNKELLSPPSDKDHHLIPGIEATVTEVIEDPVFPSLNVTLKNNTETDWHYRVEGTAVMVEVLVDGEWHLICHAPNIELTYVNVINYNEVVMAGSEDKRNIVISHYGVLPPGEYRIVIPGEGGFTCGGFEIKEKA